MRVITRVGIVWKASLNLMILEFWLVERLNSEMVKGMGVSALRYSSDIVNCLQLISRLKEPC